MNKISNLKVKRSPGAPPARPRDIDGASFPDQPARRSDGPPSTVANVRHMLDTNGVTVRYNIIRKRTEIAVPWVYGTTENNDSVTMTHVLSLASQYGMPTGLVPQIVEAIGDENSYNPAADWINGRAWDGVDRLPAFFATITPREGYPVELRDLLMRRWILSVAAAAIMPDGFRCRGVLTLQGAQGLGKTTWGMKLIDDVRLGKQLIKLGSGLIDQSQKMTVAAMQMEDMKVWAHRS